MSGLNVGVAVYDIITWSGAVESKILCYIILASSVSEGGSGGEVATITFSRDCRSTTSSVHTHWARGRYATLQGHSPFLASLIPFHDPVV